MTIINCISSGLGQTGESFLPGYLEACANSDADVDYSDTKSSDSDVNDDQNLSLLVL